MVVVVFFFIRKNDCGYFKKPKGNVLVSEIKLMIIMISRRRSSAGSSLSEYPFISAPLHTFT